MKAFKKKKKKKKKFVSSRGSGTPVQLALDVSKAHIW